PNEITQKEISDFLDEKCSEIASLRTDIEKEIAMLEDYKKSLITETVTKGLNPNVEMKNSEIEFIGKIPKSWEVIRVKNIGEYRNGLTYAPTDLCDENEGTLVLRSSNIQNGELVFNDNIYVSKIIPSYLLVNKNDILICSRNGSQKFVGKNAIIPSNLTASFGAFMMVLKCNKKALPKYIYYLLNSGVFNYYLGSFFTSTINQLTGQNFGNMKIPFCADMSIQNSIVLYLDEKCKEIDAIINGKKRQLETLEDYKKSLIYEYVTGKKEV
ncbi:MAG: restriction endonuclease subunit S, partial [Oscillospiraceae bacterium]